MEKMLAQSINVPHSSSLSLVKIHVPDTVGKQMAIQVEDTVEYNCATFSVHSIVLLS